MVKRTRNAFEKGLEKQLKKAKVKYEYETERIPYSILGNYIPDFIISLGEHKIYVEAKGYFRIDAKRKMIAVKKQHPELDIRFVFYSKKKSDIKFAEKYGFPYAIGEIPKEWLR